MKDFRSIITRDILPRVETPAQYVGGEWGSVTKAPGSVALRVALAFPETYAIGMSHLGMAVIYHITNSRDDSAAERVFAPWPDMAAELARHDLPLVTLESFTPVREFDVLAFTLQYEVTYTNVLMMLEMAGIPVRARDRSDSDPIVIAGGPGALAPEPMADFIDVMSLGDAEANLELLLDTIRDARAARAPRAETLLRVARAGASFYVPSLYEPMYDDHRRHSGLRPLAENIPASFEPAVCRDLDAAPFPTRPIVPFAKIVHDRVSIEIMRGCPAACRFCQARAHKRPVRFRSVERIVELAEAVYASTGYNEFGLLSLSSGDYPELESLMAKLRARFDRLGVSFSLPSLRVTPSLADLPYTLSAVRKSGITVAPEAATPELRAILGKNLSHDDLVAGALETYRAGWDTVKLYFMIGLPGETPEDIDAIGEMVDQVSAARRELGRGRGKVNVTLAPFVPKPHTPFQWEPMADRAYLEDARARILRSSKSRRIRFKCHNVQRSLVEAALGRGDRRVGRVIERARQMGARLDAWDEHFDPELWERAFEAEHIDPAEMRNRRLDIERTLPWDHIRLGIRRERLEAEARKVRREIDARLADTLRRQT
jgi:radical SAM family uncharacterized protein